MNILGVSNNFRCFEIPDFIILLLGLALLQLKCCCHDLLQLNYCSTFNNLLQIKYSFNTTVPFVLLGQITNVTTFVRLKTIRIFGKININEFIV